MIAGAVAMAMALTALIFVLATPGVAPASPAKMQWESLAQRSVRTSMLPEEGEAPAEEAPEGPGTGSGAEGAAPEEEAPAEEGEAPAAEEGDEDEEADPEAVHEPGFKP